MTLPQSPTTSESSLRRYVLNAAQYYLGNRWMPLVLGGVLAVSVGLYFGGWSWLVAIGAAPIILSTLPCLIMCGLGVCAMCRSGRKEAASPPGAVDRATSASALGSTTTDAPLIANLNGCHDDIRENPANTVEEDSTAQREEMPHA